MFRFGWKLLCAALIDTLFSNLYGLIMGKIYNQAVLGIYNRGEQFPKLIATNLGTAIQSVLLPAFAARQDDLNQVRTMVRGPSGSVPFRCCLCSSACSLWRIPWCWPFWGKDGWCACPIFGSCAWPIPFVRFISPISRRSTLWGEAMCS